MTIELEAPPVTAAHIESHATTRLRIVPGLAFDDVMATLDGACQEQTYAYNRARYPAPMLEPVVVSEGAEVLGAAVMLVQRLPLGIASVALTKWGPAMRDSGDTGAFALVATALVNEYARRRGMLLSLMPRVSPEPTNRHYEALLALGFTPGEQLREPDRYLLPLRLSDDEMRKGFEQKFRNQLNKAIKLGLTFERAGADGLPVFKALFAEMSQRKNYSNSAVEAVPALVSHPNPALRAELFIVRHEGTPLAAGVVFKAGDTAVYLYAGTATAGLPYNAGHFMNFNVMRWLRDNTRARWYNLGGADGQKGLITFKMGLIGKTGVVSPFPPSALYAENPWAGAVGKAALGARRQLGELRHRLGRH